MRRIALLLTVALALVGAALVPANALGSLRAPLAQLDPGVGGFMSPNLSYGGTLVNDSPGVGARFMNIKGQKRFYVSSIQGLTIYEVSNPAVPIILGQFELPNWENEDVSVSADGSRILMTEFTGSGYIHVFDVIETPGTPVTNGPLLVIRLVGERPLDAAHIVDCIDAACTWVYGSEGQIWRLTKDATTGVVTITPQSQGWATQTGLSTGGHNVEIDSAGLVWTDTSTIGALDVTNPGAPTLVMKGSTGPGTAYQHNSIRPGAKDYEPRVTPEELADPNVRPGELLLANGETNFTGTCGSGSGPFATYQITGLQEGANTAKGLKLLNVFRPVSGMYQNGDPAVNTIGCSGHWFTTHPTRGAGLVAAAWYEHGTRLLSVNEQTGKVTQAGYFQPVVGSASAAHWVSDEYIYVVDYERGIDILRYDKTKPVPTTEQFDRSWLAKVGVVSAAAEAERRYCRLAASN